jgi:hypothetical protein
VSLCFFFWRQGIVFDVTYKLQVHYKMECRNRYLKGRNNGQMNPRGYANFNSYNKNLLFVFIMDRQMVDREINPGGAG